MVSFIQRFIIVGAGPSGFYTAREILKKMANVSVTLIDSEPTPFGLARFGIAPDHKKPKKVINEFNKILKDPRCEFFGNVKLGKNVSLEELRKQSETLILACGASEDKLLNVKGENNKRIVSAKSFVEWYNGKVNCKLDLDFFNLKNVLIIGNGNVSLDCARILCCDKESLSKTDLTERSLSLLKRLKLENVFLVGRKGPLESKFSVSELKKIIKLENRILFDEKNLMNYNDKQIQFYNKIRISKKKLILFKELLNRNANYSKNHLNNPKINFKFNYKLKCLNELKNGKIEAIFDTLNGQKIIDTDLVLRSIGYKVKPLLGIPFNKNKDTVLEDGNGRVKGFNNVYVCGWMKTGSKGVIANTLIDAKITTNTIIEDLKKRNQSKSLINPKNNSFRNFLNNKKIQFIDKKGWEKIDFEEKLRGSALDKEREKIIDFNDIIKIAN